MKPLSRLFNPKSIAVIGGNWASNVIRQLIGTDYVGEIWWIHPEKQRVDGVTCFQSIEALPSPPDVAFIGVNRVLTVTMVQALSEVGAGGACCFASGFLESEGEQTGGGALQEQLVNAAGDMPVLGPNCYGYLNYLDNVALWPDAHGGLARKTGVAILTQSSNIAISFSMQQRGLPIASIITTGNQAVVSMANIANSLLEDDRVTAIGMHVEGFRDIRGFERLAARAKQLGKPIVVFKVGKSVQAQKATLTHTASLAGSEAGANALAKRLGFVCVENIGEFLETLKLLHHFGPLAGNKVASISCSGGEASIMADAAVAYDLNYKPLSSIAKKKLKAVLGPLVTIANPLDYHTFIWGDFDKMRDTYKAVIEDGMDLTFFVFDLPRSDRCIPDAWFPAIDSLKAAVSLTGARVAVVPTMHENLPESWAEDLSNSGIVVLYGIGEAHAATDAAHLAYQMLNSPVREPVQLVEKLPGTDRDMETLSEYESKSMLGEFGLGLPNFQFFSSTEQLEHSEIQLNFPVALKKIGIAHKTEIGAVALDIPNQKDLVDAAKQMPQLGDGFLIEEMVAGSVCELIVGVTRDEAHGFLLTIGAGGIYTELLDDSESLLLPTTRDEIELSIKTLKIHRLLSGYRGKPAGDMEAVIDQIYKISRFAQSHANDLEELDVNPLIVCQNGAKIADALIILRRNI